MSNEIVAAHSASHNYIGSFGSERLNGLAAGVQYMSIDELLAYCQDKMRRADEGIRNSMAGLDSITNAQEALAQLKSVKIDPQTAAQYEEKRKQLAAAQMALQYGNARTQLGEDKETKYEVKSPQEREELKKEIEVLEAEMATLTKEFDAALENACAKLEACGQSDAAKALRDAANGVKSGDKEAMDRFQRAVDAQASSIGSSREMAMVRLQSLVSQRGTMLQMITNMMSALNEAPKAIAANCRG